MAGGGAQVRSGGAEQTAALVERSRQGDRAALQQLLESCDSDVTNIAFRLIGNRDDAMDIRQQAYIRAWQGLSRFDGRSSFHTWLMRITINLCRDHIRRRGAEKRRADGWKLQAETKIDSYAALGRDAPDDRQQMLADMVAALPDAQREVLVLRHHHDMTLTATAELLEIPLSTAASRLSAGLRKLRDLLEGSQTGGEGASNPAARRFSGAAAQEKGTGHVL